MIYAILSSNSLTYGHWIITPIMYICFISSIGILIYKFINFKNYLKLPETLIIFTILLAISISTLANFQYNFKKNFIFIVYWVIYFLILFSTKKNKNISDIKKDLKFALTVFLIYTTVAVTASLILYICDVSVIYSAADSEYGYNLGFVWGRLWGIFINPNNGAVSSAISIIILIYGFITSKKFCIKILSVVSVILHLLYISLSDSRSGAVVLAVAIGIFTFCTIINKYKNRKIWTKLLICVISILISAGCLAAVRSLKTPINSTVKFISQVTDSENENTIDRGYDMSNDISNRRFDVWKSGLEVFTDSTKNIIIGTSFGGFTDYAKENLPNTYIVNNDFGIMNTLDNELINVLVSNGVIGFAAIAVFVICAFITLFKKFKFTEQKNRKLLSLTLAITFSLVTAAMFGSVMFYHFSPNGIIFWFVFGRCMALLQLNKEIKNK